MKFVHRSFFEPGGAGTETPPGCFFASELAGGGLDRLATGIVERKKR